MVLSKLTLNLRSGLARRDLSDAYEMHSTLMRLVDAGASKPLWRLERRRYEAPPEILIQTESEPEWGVLKDVDEEYYLDASSRRNQLLEQIKDGDVLNFRVRANPTVKREGKRHGLVKLEHQIEWMERQLVRHGGHPLHILPSESRRETMKRRKGGRPIIIHGVTFDGTFVVEDVKGVRSLVTSGVGHGRALGFGLVTLAR